MSSKKQTNKSSAEKRNSITNYFPQTKNVIIDIDKEKNGKKESEEFYEICLEQLTECTMECQKEKEELKMKINELKEKIEKVEGAIESCCSVISEKENEITKLQGQSSQNGANELNQPKILFESFNDVFDAEQLNKLKSISKTDRSDSTFVCTVIKYLYAENLESIGNKTACGRNKKNHDNKEMMTPTKKKVVQDIYSERLCDIAVNLDERQKRENKLNRLIKDAFANIKNSSESQKKEREALNRLTANGLDEI